MASDCHLLQRDSFPSPVRGVQPEQFFCRRHGFHVSGQLFPQVCQWGTAVYFCNPSSGPRKFLSCFACPECGIVWSLSGNGVFQKPSILGEGSEQLLTLYRCWGFFTLHCDCRVPALTHVQGPNTHRVVSSPSKLLVSQNFFIYLRLPPCIKETLSCASVAQRPLCVSSVRFLSLPCWDRIHASLE